VPGTIRVPEDKPTIAAAIAAAQPGDVVLVGVGRYRGSVTVPPAKHDIAIRGVDRNQVVFDGDGVRKSAISVRADGVSVENLSAHDFVGNVFYWDGVKRFKASYLTVWNVLGYGIYAEGSTDGVVDHDYVSGAADAAYYIGECRPCRSVLTQLTARLSAVGYSGTNASGELTIRDSLWDRNGAGILPNSYANEADPPQAAATIVGNTVVGSGTAAVPIHTPLVGFYGIGIGIAGGVSDRVDHNRVRGSSRYGIAIFPTAFWVVGDPRPQPPGPHTPWRPTSNIVSNNVVQRSGLADLALSAGSGLDNCFRGNHASVTLPARLDGSCPSKGDASVASRLTAPQATLTHRGFRHFKSVDFTDMPVPPRQPNMPAHTGMRHALRSASAVLTAVPVETLTGLSSCDESLSVQRGLIANAEVEPSLASDDAGRKLVVVFQEDRSSRGGAGSIVVVTSSDGGSSWRSPTRLFGSCAPSARPVSDPWAAVGATGRIYATALDTGAGIVARSSSDGGTSWSRVRRIATQTPSAVFDKPTVTADAQRRNAAYAVWEQYPVSAGQSPIAGDTALSVTGDGGRSWSKPRIILRHADAFGPMTTNLLAGREAGVLYALSLWIHGPEPGVGEPSEILLQRSSDGGLTWTRPTHAGTVRSAWTALRDPATGKQIRPSVPSFALDPRSGRLYAVWADDRFSASPDIDHVVMSSSPDGRRWSAPRRIDPASAALAIIPSVAAGADGTLAISYFSVSAKASKTTYWLARSRDGGRSFTRARMAAAFSLADAPFLTGNPALLVPGGYFLGDYMGLTATAKGFTSAFVTANRTRKNPSDVRFALAK
jgi:hypothetical protein